MAQLQKMLNPIDRTRTEIEENESERKEANVKLSSIRYVRQMTAVRLYPHFVLEHCGKTQQKQVSNNSFPKQRASINR